MTNQKRPLVRRYYVASDKLIEFIENGQGKAFARFASAANVSARSLARLRQKERVTRVTADQVLRAAGSVGFKISFEKAFSEAL